MERNTKHKAIDTTYAQRISDLLYSKTDEKVIAADLLRKIFKDRKFKHLLDVGAGPGEIVKPLAELSEHLTMVEILPEYKEILLNKYPHADIVIDSIENISLKTEFDLIFISHVLYYFPENEWLGVVKKLYDALLPDGNLVITMMRDSGDWWRIVNNYWRQLRKYIRFDYIPLSKFKKILSKIGPMKTYTFSFKVAFDSEETLIDCIGQETLQINNREVLKKYHDDFAKFASNFQRIKNKVILNSDCEIIVLDK